MTKVADLIFQNFSISPKIPTVLQNFWEIVINVTFFTSIY